MNGIRECVGSPRSGFTQIGGRIFPGDPDWPAGLEVPSGWPEGPVQSPNGYYDPDSGWGVTAPKPFGASSAAPFGTVVPPPPGLATASSCGTERGGAQEGVVVKVLLGSEQVFCGSVRGGEVVINIYRASRSTPRTPISASEDGELSLVDESNGCEKHPSSNHE